MFPLLTRTGKLNIATVANIETKITFIIRTFLLINFSSLNRSKNEISQNLEGNRAIDNLIPIKMIKIDFHGISIDTEKDFIEAEKYLSKNA